MTWLHCLKTHEHEGPHQACWKRKNSIKVLYTCTYSMVIIWLMLFRESLIQAIAGQQALKSGHTLQGLIQGAQCFSQKILLEDQSGPGRLVLGARFLGKGPIDNNWQKEVAKCKCLAARYYHGDQVRRPLVCQKNNRKAYMT